jgi:hypothetical protein
VAKIKAPNKELQGSRAGLVFIDGEAYTDDPRQADFFARNGYSVSVQDGDGDHMKEVVKRSKALAEDPLSHQTAEEAYIQRGVPPEDAAMTSGLTDEGRAQVAGPGAGPLIPLVSPLTAPAMIGPGLSAGGPAEQTPGGKENPDPMPTSGSRAGMPAGKADRPKVTATGQKGIDEAREGARKSRRERAAKKTTRKSSRSKSTTARDGDNTGGSGS